jgi:hypothetical protein
VERLCFLRPSTVIEDTNREICRFTQSSKRLLNSTSPVNIAASNNRALPEPLSAALGRALGMRAKHGIFPPREFLPSDRHCGGSRDAVEARTTVLAPRHTEDISSC